jgi:hypothetical protein
MRMHRVYTTTDGGLLELLQAARWAVLGELQTIDAEGKPTWVPDVLHKGFGFQSGEPDVVFHALLKSYALIRWPSSDLNIKVGVEVRECGIYDTNDFQYFVDDALKREEEPVLCFNSAPLKFAFEFNKIKAEIDKTMQTLTSDTEQELNPEERKLLQKLQGTYRGTDQKITREERELLWKAPELTPQENIGLISGTPLKVKSRREIMQQLRELPPSDRHQPHGVVIARKEEDGVLVIKDSAFNDALPKSSWKIKSVDELNFVVDDLHVREIA